MTGRLGRIPLHSLFMALYPVTAVLASNMGQVKPSVAGRSTIVSLLVGLGLLLAMRVFTRNWSNAGLLTTWALGLFYAYGHVYNMLRGLETAGPSFGRHRIMVPIWLLLGAAGVWLVVKKHGSLSWITPALNLTLGVALIFPIGEILLFQRRMAIQAEATLARTFGDRLSTATGVPLPDVYYIVLDAYTSADVLRNSFDQDNGPFLSSLRQMDFLVPECSQSNYSQTELSLAATLNMAYLEELIDETVPGEEGRSQLWPLIRHSAVRRTLEDIGYRTIAFETGYYWSEWEDADLYLAPGHGLFQGLSAFEATLLRSTAAWALVDVLPGLPAFLVRDLDRSTDAHRDRLLYVFGELEGVAMLPGPKFVFAHIVSPHRPFVFDAQGNPADDDYGWEPSDLGFDAYRERYLEQVTYLNSRMTGVIHEILTNSSHPPVIIVQGDHGPEEGSSQDRMQILNATYLVGRGADPDNEQVSPVNAFRYVLSTLFGAELPLLEDVSYFSTYDRPFDYSIVPNECQADTDP